MRGGRSFEGRGGLVLIKRERGWRAGGGRACNLCVEAINPSKKGINLTVLEKKISHQSATTVYNRRRHTKKVCKKSQPTVDLSLYCGARNICLAGETRRAPIIVRDAMAYSLQTDKVYGPPTKAMDNANTHTPPTPPVPPIIDLDAVISTPSLQ